MPKGFIKLEREIWEEELFNDGKPLSRREAWIWLLCHVDYKTNEIAVSQRELAKVWGWNLRKVNWFINELKEKGRLKLVKHQVKRPNETPNKNESYCYSIVNEKNKSVSETQKRNAKRNDAREPIYNIKNNKEYSHTQYARGDFEKDYFSEAQADTQYRARTCNSLGISGEEFDSYLEAFRNETTAKAKRHKDYADFRSHFYDWLRRQTKQRQYGSNRGNIETKQQQLERWRKEDEAERKRIEAASRASV